MVLMQELEDLLLGVQYSDEAEEFDQQFYDERITIGKMPPTNTTTEQISRKNSEAMAQDLSNHSKDLITNLNEKTRAKRMKDEMEQFNQTVIRAKIIRDGEPMSEEAEKL